MPPRVSLVPLAKLKIHRLAEFYPPMAEKEYLPFAADVKANGVQTPIIRYEGQVLDGRNRVRAARDAGILLVPVQDYPGIDPIGRAVAGNLRRKRYQVGELAALGAEIEREFVAEAEARRQGPHGDNFVPSGKSRIRAAKVVRVSAGSIQTAGKILQEAPELFAELKAGTLTLAQAKRELCAAEGKRSVTPEVEMNRQRARRAIKAEGAALAKRRGVVWCKPGAEWLDAVKSRVIVPFETARLGGGGVVIEIRDITAGAGRDAYVRKVRLSYVLAADAVVAIAAALAERRQS